MISMNDNPEPSSKTCPRCGAGFECLHAPGCWCTDYTLLPEKLNRLKQEFDNCLCPQCLALYASKIKERDSEAGN